jgi:hypothetical protein
MCWKCDNPDGTTEQYLAELRALSAIHGWAVQYVEDEDRPFAYTIGLHDKGLPELMVTGLSGEASARLLNAVARMTVNGTRLAPAEHINLGDRYHLEVVEVEHPDVHLKFAARIFGQHITALQLVWADHRGRWPWDAGWGCGRRRQPVLGVRAQWPPAA